MMFPYDPPIRTIPIDIPISKFGGISVALIKNDGDVIVIKRDLPYGIMEWFDDPYKTQEILDNASSIQSKE